MASRIGQDNWFSASRLQVRVLCHLPILLIIQAPPKVQTRYINQWRPTEATIGHKLRGVVCGPIGTVVVLPPTFGRAKVPPMSLKAGKDVRLTTYCPFPFYFHKFFTRNLQRGIVVKSLINYQYIRMYDIGQSTRFGSVKQCVRLTPFGPNIIYIAGQWTGATLGSYPRKYLRFDSSSRYHSR